MRKTLLLVLLFVSFNVYAQQHYLNRYPQIYFDRGVELYEEARYNAAIFEFTEYAKSNPQNLNSSDMEFYYAMSKLKAEHTDAIAVMNAYIAKNSESSNASRAYLAMGDYYYLMEKYSTALSNYKNVDIASLGMGYSDQFNFRKGFCCVFTKKYKEAKELLEPVAQKGGQYQNLGKYYYGYSCLMEKDYEAAFVAFNGIKDRRFEKVHYYMAQVYYQLNRYNEALAELDKLNGSNKIPQKEMDWLRGKCYFRLQDYAKASDYFSHVNILAEKMSPEEQFEVGYAYSKSGNYSACFPWFRGVAKNNDSLAQQASYELGCALLKMKTYREAMNAFSEAWRTGFNETVAEISLFNQAKIAVQLGESNSITLLDKYIKVFASSPNAKEASKLKARLLLNTDKYREAVAILENMDDLDPQTEEVYQKVTLARGMELYKGRNFDGAIALFDKGLKKNANQTLAAAAAFWKAEALAQLGKTESATDAYKTFLDKPHSTKIDEFAYAYYGLGYLKFDKKEYAAAASFYSEFTNKVAGLHYDERLVHDAYLRLGDCYVMTKQYDKAVNAYAYVSGKNGPDADYALYQSSILYGLMEKPDEKIGALKHLNSSYPHSRFTVDAYNDIASEYMIKRQFAEAEKYYNKLLNEFPGSQTTAKAYSTLGKIYYNEKKIDQAVDAYTKLFDGFQGTNDAKLAAEMVKTIYTDAGRARDYINWASKRGGLAKVSEDSLMYETATNAYDREDYDVAVKSFDAYLKEMPNGNFVIPANYYKAQAHESLKQPQKAIDCYQYVAKANSGDLKEEATLAVLRIYGNNASCDEILPYVEILESITKSKDIQRRTWKSLMYCYSKSKNSEGLNRIAAKVLEDNTSDEDMKFESKMILAKSEMAGPDYSKALQSLKNIYTGNTSRFAAEAKYLEAEMYFKIDSLNSCKESCYGVMDNFNGYDHWVGKAILLLGDAFAKENDMLNAKVTWNTIVENFSDKEMIAEAKKRIKDNHLDVPEKKK